MMILCVLASITVSTVQVARVGTHCLDLFGMEFPQLVWARGAVNESGCSEEGTRPTLPCHGWSHAC
jgi:hypothetical protein